jgi:uncharacterized protein YsxB (DUF464 family)
VIEIVAALDKKGLLRTFAVNGHSFLAPAGQDIVCAAVTVLANTAANILAATDGIVFQGSAPKRGELFFEVKYNAPGEAFLAAIGRFLLEGLSSVAHDYPVNCKLNIVEFGG